MRIWPHLVSLAVALGLVVALATPPVFGARVETGHPLLPRAQLLKLVGAGNLQFAADLYWIALLQQAGVAHHTDDYKAIYDYSTLVSDLDPRFDTNYRFSALIIPFNAGREQWTNGEEAMAVIDRGLKEFPEDLRLWLYRAHTCMFVLRDYPKAAESLRRASRLPGAPAITAQLATRVMAQAGEYDSAKMFARTMADSSPDPAVKEFFERRLREIDLEAILSKVDLATMSYWRREGTQPESVQVLVDAHDLAQMPVDPLGGAIQLDGYGRARSTSTRFRLELFEADTKLLTPGGRGEPVLPEVPGGLLE